MLWNTKLTVTVHRVPIVFHSRKERKLDLISKICTLCSGCGNQPWLYHIFYDFILLEDQECVDIEFVSQPLLMAENLEMTLKVL